MRAEEELKWEKRIVDLLAGELGEPDRGDLIASMCHHPEVRDLAIHIIELQRLARRATGLEPAEAAISGSLAETLDALTPTMDQPSAPESTGPPAPLRPRVRPVFALLRVAAVLLFGVLGYGVHWLTTPDRSESPVVGPGNAAIALPEPRPEEVAALRQTWKQIALASDHASPWVSLSNGVGEFGYVPADQPAANEKHLLMVRCVIVGSDRAATVVNVLLADQPSATLTIPVSGRLGDRGMDLLIVSKGKQLEVSLKATAASGQCGGLHGTIGLGQAVLDAGQFQLDGSMFKVFLQAMPLAAG